MKNLRFVSHLMAVILLLAACQQTVRHHEDSHETAAIASSGIFGEEFNTGQAVPAADLTTLFGEQDSVAAIVTGHIKASCKHSGCWMDVDLGGQDVVHVTFKDDGFTIPLDAAGKNAVVQGMAYRNMVPVETLRNYAREEGMSEDEIALITEPAWEYEFVASGVVIQE